MLFLLSIFFNIVQACDDIPDSPLPKRTTQPAIAFCLPAPIRAQILEYCPSKIIHQCAYHRDANDQAFFLLTKKSCNKIILSISKYLKQKFKDYRSIYLPHRKTLDYRLKNDIMHLFGTALSFFKFLPEDNYNSMKQALFKNNYSWKCFSIIMYPNLEVQEKMRTLLHLDARELLCGQYIAAMIICKGDTRKPELITWNDFKHELEAMFKLKAHDISFEIP